MMIYGFLEFLGIKEERIVLCVPFTSFILFLCLFITSAQAISFDKGSGTLTVTRDECDELFVDATPDADVAYQAGVDVDGNLVASADVAGTPQLVLPETVTLPIELKDLTNYFGVNQGPYVHDAEIADATFNLKDGSLTFNGHPLTSPLMQKIKEACGK